MIKIKSIYIDNIFQYSDYHAEFADNINLILGPNGSGKTNLLNCIFYAITGLLPMPKKYCTNYFTNKKSSSVTLELIDSQGQKLTIIRPLTGKAKCVTNEVNEGSENSKDIISEFFGVHFDFITEGIYLKQKDLRGFTESSPLERLEKLQKLLAIKRLESLHNLIGSFISDKMSRLKIIDDKQINQYNSLVEERSKIGTLRNLNEVDKDISEILLQQKLLNEISSLNKKLSESQKKLYEYNQSLSSLGSKKLDFKEDPLFEEYHLRQNELKDLMNKLNSTISKFKNRPKVIKVDSDKLSKLRTDYITANNRTQELKKCLELLKGKETSVCPLCGHVLDKDKIEHLKAELEKSSRQEEIIKKKIEEFRYITAKAEEVKKERKRLLDNIKVLNSMKRSCKNLLSISREDYLQYLNNKKEFNDTVKQINQLKKFIEFEEHNIKELQQQVNKYSSVIKIADDTDVSLRKLQQEKELILRAAELDANINLLKDFIEEAKESQAKKEILSKIAKVRDIFHPKNLPAELMKVIIYKINSKINEYLQLFDSPFLITIKENMEIISVYKNGTELPVESLSFGEQVMVTLSFYVSLSQIVGYNGFMILDEPTLGLDDDRLQAIPEILKKLSEQSGSIQLLCSTHERRLTSCASKIIELI